VFSDLAARYATDGLRFGALDVGTWPGAAEKAGVEVSAPLLTPLLAHTSAPAAGMSACKHAEVCWPSPCAWRVQQAPHVERGWTRAPWCTSGSPTSALSMC